MHKFTKKIYKKYKQYKKVLKKLQKHVKIAVAKVQNSRGQGTKYPWPRYKMQRKRVKKKVGGKNWGVK